MLYELYSNKAIKKRIAQKLWLWKVKLVIMNKATDTGKNKGDHSSPCQRGEP